MAIDPNLVAHEEHLRYRWNQYRSTRASIEKNEGSLANFAKSYERYGIVHENVSGVWLRGCGVAVGWLRLQQQAAQPGLAARGGGRGWPAKYTCWHGNYSSSSSSGAAVATPKPALPGPPWPPRPAPAPACRAVLCTASGPPGRWRLS